MFATTLSALYGKLLVVMGIAFPMAEVISTYVPPSFYEVMNFFSQATDRIDERILSVCNRVAFVFPGILFIFVRWKHVISILHVRHIALGSTEAIET